MSDYFNAALIKKYQMAGPRYTSYPTAVQFKEDFTADDYIAQLKASNEVGRDISLYAHVPFCENLCYFCGCNKIITHNHTQSTEYLDYLRQDIAWQAAQIDSSRRVVQLHLGGGTPTFLSKVELTQLLTMLRSNFTFVGDSEGEFSIEIDPRTVDYDGLAYLRELGFNRVSFGVQDFDVAVQQAVNRVQPITEVARLIGEARALGFRSTSVDLIYGLPRQNLQTFTRTIDAMIELSPDRIAVFNYAHMPHLFGAQKQINANDLPSADEKLAMLEHTIYQLTEAGYVFIGLDHFAKPQDSLVQHQKKGTLYRNFQGYSTFSNCDLLGFGISAISQVHDSYSQHEKARSKYYARIKQGEIPTARGVILSLDDKIRREAITEIMCNLRLDIAALCDKYQKKTDYFAHEWQVLEVLNQDGLIDISKQVLHVRAPGRLLIRNIAMVFDAYLQAGNNKRFSQVI